jgi:ankyrin repeat protein
VNVCDEANMTPLMWAAYNAQSKHMQLLLDKGADTHLVDIDGMAAVHWSIHKNDTSCLKLLLTHESSKFRCHKGKTVIHYAAEQGSADCACITMAVRPNCVDDTDNEGRTALHWAAACQKPEVIRAVLAAQGT